MIAWLQARWFAVLSTLVALGLCVPSLDGFWRVARSRLDEPYALWWLEPLFYRTALAVYQGLPLYPAPNLEYTPPIYNPGLNLVGGALIATVGEGYPPLRWFSFACFVGLGLMLAYWSWRETKSPAVALSTFAVATSLQAPMGRWITAINVDTPSLCFGFLGLLLATSTRLTNGRAVAAGLCVTLGFAFKQPACLLALPALAHLGMTDRKRALWFAVACAGSALLMVGALWIASDGWYWTYAFEIPLQTPKRDVSFVTHWIDRHRLAALSLMVAPPLLMWLGPARLRFFWVPLALSAVLMAQQGFTKDGGDMNTLLPAYVAGALCLGLLPACVARFGTTKHAAVIAMVLIGAVTLGAGWSARDKLSWFRERAVVLELDAQRPHPPRHTYPHEAAFERRLRDLIGQLPKPVFVGARFFGPQGPLNTHQTGLYEGTSRTRLFDLRAQIEPVFRRQHYQSLVLWSYWYDDAFDRLVERYYVKGPKVFADPTIGLHVHVWMPKARWALPTAD